MKKIILITILFFTILNSNAQQIEIDVFVQPPYQLNLDGLTNQLLTTVRNTNLNEPLNNVNFRLDLHGPRGLRIFSDRVFDDDIDLNAGEVRQFIGNDWDALYESVNLTIEPASEEQRIIDTQTLRDGAYQICITAYNTLTNQILSSGVPSDCTDFNVEVPDTPEINLPFANFTVPNEGYPLLVNWIHLNTNSELTYTLEIVDATMFPHNTFNVDEVFLNAESVFREDDIQSLSFVVEDVDWEDNHDYEIRVTAVFGDILSGFNLHSRTVRIHYENTQEETDNEDSEEIPEEQTPQEEIPEEEITDGEPATITATDKIKVGENGEFEVELTELTGNINAYTGKGTVFIEWLQARVNASFKNIKVDANKKIIFGKVVVDIADNPPLYPKDWPLEVATNNTWTNAAAGSIKNWVENASGQEIPYQSLNEFSTPLDMPLGLHFDLDNKLILTEMRFDKNDSQFNIIVAKSTPLEWGNPQTIGFIAKEITFHPTEISTSPKRLELLADLLINDANLNTSYTFKAPTNTRTGCYIEWNDNGFSLFGIDLESELSRDWIIPVTDNGEKVKISLTAESDAWDNLILTGNLPESEIVGTEGTTIKAVNISYDMSDILNPTGITFPENYQGEDTELFRGFYAKNIKLKLPEIWETSTNGALEIDVTNMIIDNQGITMKADATNIASFNTTNVVELSASIDNVHIEIVANSLSEASINGKIGLPITDMENIAEGSKITYNASLHVVSNSQNNQNDESNFQITLTPSNLQEIDFDLIHSKIKIDNNSSIEAYVSDSKKTFELDLSGSVNISDINVGPLSLNSIGMKVEHMVLKYDSSPNKGFTFDEDNTMTWGKSSPQKSLVNTTTGDDGYNLNFLNISYENKTKQTGEFMRGALLIETQVGLAENITGIGSIAIVGAIKEDNNSFSKFKPMYVKTSLDSLSIVADLSAVKIIGSISMREDDPVYGDGFRGELEAQFKTVKASVSAVAEFGTVSNYKYWSVQAGLDLPTPIALSPGVSFYGLGGGAYYNMKATPNSNNNNSWTNKYIFTPNKNKAGLSLKARLGAPKIETYNADVEISAEIGVGSNSGINNINFNGDLWVGATVAKRTEAPIKGNVSISYDFNNDIFDLTTNATVNMKALTAKDVGMQIYANGTNGNWFFKFGDPFKTNTVTIDLGVGAVDMDSYFMFGNHIPVPENFTTSFMNGYHAALGHYPGSGMEPTTEATEEGSNAQFGAGIALGVGFNFQAGGYIPLALNYHAGIAGIAGAELNLSLLEYKNLIALNKGYNGWQAGGSIGFYGKVNAGVFKKRNNGTYDEKFTLAEFAGGGYVIGRFPNPVYVEGEIEGRIKILCLFNKCLINADANIGFNYGEKLSDAERGQPATEIIKAEVNEIEVESRDLVLENMDKHIIKYIHPQNKFSFSPIKPIAVKYYQNPNQMFEVPDMDRLRVFKFETNITLQEISPLTCRATNLDLNVSINDNGELLYIADSNLNWAGKGIDIGFLNNQTNDLPFGSNNNTQNSVINNLAPQTNYKFIVATVLKELISDNWEFALLDQQRIEETVAYKFRTSGFDTFELTEADALFTEMPMLEYYNMSDEDRYIFSAQFPGVFNPNSTIEPYISEDGKCECQRLNYDDKLTFYSQIQEGISDNPSVGFGYYPKAYRDYPDVNSTADAITVLGMQQIDGFSNVTEMPNTGVVDTGYSPTGFDYNIINNATEGSFFSIGGFTP